MPRSSLQPRHIPIYAFLVLFAVYALFPIIWTFSTSLKPPTEAVAYPPRFIPQNITLENYAHVLTRTAVPRYIWNTLVVSLGTVVLVIAASALAGYAFSRFRFRGKDLLLLSLLICVMVSGATKVIPLYLLLLELGLLNAHLGLILTYAAELIPISTWLMKSYCDSIPDDLDEACMLDGAGRVRVFFSVIIPLSIPGIMAVMLFSFIKASQEFIYASTFISEPSLKTAPVGLYGFLTEIGVQWSYLAAASLLVVMPIVLVFLLLQRWFISGLTTGAVK